MSWVDGPAGRIHYVEQGDGPALLLSHGVIESSRSWERVAPLLARRFRTVVHDARGRGGSDVAPMTFADLVDDVRALAEHLDVRPVLHAGHSMGARVALEHALADPAGVRAIALISGRASAPDNAGRARLAALAERAARAGSAAAIDPWIEPDDPLYGVVRDISAANSSDGTRAALECLASADPIVDRLDAVHAPALVVVGEHDRAVYRDAARLTAERLPRAELLVLPGVGHFPNLQAPERLAGALEEFFLRSR